VGQNQYEYEAATQTWRLLGAATGVVPGTYGSVSAIPQFTVDTTGRITVAADINISSVYVKTGNAGAYNSYVWPNLDGTSSQVLTTDGAGNLSWTSYPYWQQVGNIISPISAGTSFELKDAALVPTFLSDPLTYTTSFFNGTTSVNIKADSLVASTISAAGAGSTAKPLYFEGSDFRFSAYAGSYLNTPSILTVTAGIIASSVGISTDSAFTANAGTVNSVSSPPTRGTAGQVLISNGDGTSGWITTPDFSYWNRTAATIYPRYAGDSVHVLNSAAAPVIKLLSNGTASFFSGTQNLFINPSFAADTIQLKASTTTTDPASMTIDADALDLLAYGGYFLNAPVKFQLNRTTGIKFNADFAGTRRNLFTVNLDGDLQVGYNIDSGSPALSVDGLTGDCVVQRNASIGSSSIVTYSDSINLTIGKNSANKAGLLKFVSTFNGGDGVELTQDEATGDFEIHMNHAATPVVTVNATDTTLTTNLIVDEDTTINGQLFIPFPIVPIVPTSPGITGQIAWNPNYIFVCIAPNLWKRTPISSW